jgi:hypothetical protein
LFACDPPAESVPLLEEIAADLRPERLRAQLFVMAEADQRDLLPPHRRADTADLGLDTGLDQLRGCLAVRGQVMLTMIQQQ